jgi:hypothetical protein
MFAFLLLMGGRPNFLFRRNCVKNGVSWNKNDQNIKGILLPFIRSEVVLRLLSVSGSLVGVKEGLECFEFLSVNIRPFDAGHTSAIDVAY